MTKKFGPTKYLRQKLLDRQNTNKTKYPRERISDPRNAHEGTMNRWHETHETHNDTRPTKIRTLLFVKLFFYKKL